MKLFILAIFVSAMFGLLFADQWQLYKKRFGKKFKNFKDEQIRQVDSRINERGHKFITAYLLKIRRLQENIGINQSSE